MILPSFVRVAQPLLVARDCCGGFPARSPPGVRLFGLSASMEDTSSVREAKAELRSRLRKKLSELDDAYIAQASAAVAAKVVELPEYKSCKGVACFVSMPKEFNTRPLLERIFADEKTCYLPRVESVKEHTMSMLQAFSLADVDAFPPGRWKIPEPPREGPARIEALDLSSDVDLVIVPGLGFDAENGRLGQGAGFYDRFLAKLVEAKRGSGKPLTLLGVTLDELMVSRVPRDTFDLPMDIVVWPSKPE